MDTEHRALLMTREAALPFKINDSNKPTASYERHFLSCRHAALLPGRVARWSLPCSKYRPTLPARHKLTFGGKERGLHLLLSPGRLLQYYASH